MKIKSCIINLNFNFIKKNIFNIQKSKEIIIIMQIKILIDYLKEYLIMMKLVKEKIIVYKIYLDKKKKNWINLIKKVLFYYIY